MRAILMFAATLAACLGTRAMASDDGVPSQLSGAFNDMCLDRQMHAPKFMGTLDVNACTAGLTEGYLRMMAIAKMTEIPGTDEQVGKSYSLCTTEWQADWAAAYRCFNDQADAYRKMQKLLADPDRKTRAAACMKAASSDMVAAANCMDWEKPAQ